MSSLTASHLMISGLAGREFAPSVEGQWFNPGQVKSKIEKKDS